VTRIAENEAEDEFDCGDVMELLADATPPITKEGEPVVFRTFEYIATPAELDYSTDWLDDPTQTVSWASMNRT
jgi:hypothetical protein